MHSALVTALTVADRGPGSIRHISPNTSPAPSVPTVLAFASGPTVTSAEPETRRNAVSPSSPSEMIVSPALNLTVCIGGPSSTSHASGQASWPARDGFEVRTGCTQAPYRSLTEASPRQTLELAGCSQGTTR